MNTKKENKNPKHTLHQMLRGVVAKFCDECGAQYMDDDIRIVQRDNNSVLLHLSCKSCGKTHLATIVKPLGITNRMPINTDLQSSEIKKFAGKRSVSSDDVLDAYEWCKETVNENTGAALRKITGKS